MALPRGSKELRIFEAMETLTNQDSFCSTTSVVRKFVNCNIDLNSTIQSSIPEENISHSIINSESSFAYSEEEEEEDEECEQQERQLERDKLTFPEQKRAEQSKPCPTASVVRKFVNRNLDLNSTNQSSVPEDNMSHLSENSSADSEEEDEEYGQQEKQLERDKLTFPEQKTAEQSKPCPTASVVRKFVNRNLDLNSTNQSSVPEENVFHLSSENSSAYSEEEEEDEEYGQQEKQLERDKLTFLQQKSAEQSKLQAEQKQMENQRKRLQSLVTDYYKMKNSKEDYENKLKDLTEKLRRTNLEMSKRISRWTDQQRKLEERVKSLEKENEELKKQKSLAQRPTNLKRPPMLNQNFSKPKIKPVTVTKPKRIQFADEVDLKNKSTGATDSSVNQRKVLKKGNVTNETSSKESVEVPSTSKDPEPPISNPNNEDAETLIEVSLEDEGADKTMPSNYVEMKRPCGTITRATTDNKLIRHVMPNGDIMDEFEDCSVRYYYKELKFSQTTFPNGDEIIEHDSGCLETTRMDGSKIYTFSDGLVKLIDTVGTEELFFADGSVMKKQANGESVVTWPNGQKEIRTATYAKRIFTNGTVKILYNDGSEETRYWNGRVRRKDKDGKLVDDTKRKKKSKSEGKFD